MDRKLLPVLLCYVVTEWGGGSDSTLFLIEKLENSVVLRVEENVKVIPSSLSPSQSHRWEPELYFDQPGVM